MFKRAIEYLNANFPGNTFAGGSFDHSMVTAVWELTNQDELVETYKKALSEHGIRFDEVKPALRLSSSDVGISGANLWISIYSQVSEKVKIHHIHIWEDMSGCHGSLISPKMVSEFMLPNYSKISAFAKEKGIEIVSVDTDGDVSELVPLFMEAGINLILPFEVQAGCDIVDYGRKYPDLCILGGIDKRALGYGKDEIDAELKRIVPMFERGRYFPALDHGIPPEVSLENMNYYINRLKELTYKYTNK